MSQLQWRASLGAYEAGGWRIQRRWFGGWLLYCYQVDGSRQGWRLVKDGSTMRGLKVIAESQSA